jgi:hypothetical protein
MQLARACAWHLHDMRGSSDRRYHFSWRHCDWIFDVFILEFTVTDTLLEAIREVLLLDSKRTKGDWQMSNDKTLVGDLGNAVEALKTHHPVTAELFQRALTELKRREWRPISEAPKDRILLLWWRDAAHFGRWYDETDNWIWLDSSEGVVFDASDQRMKPPFPTHFQELPEPPTEQTT